MKTVGTVGVIGALVFSGLFSTLQVPLNPSSDSTNYFSDDAIIGLSYLYYGLLYCSFIGSCYVVLMSSMSYPLGCRTMSYATGIFGRRQFYQSSSELVLSLITIICGIAVNLGPNQALMCLLAVLLTGLTLGLQFMKLLSIFVAALHKHCKSIVSETG